MTMRLIVAVIPKNYQNEILVQTCCQSSDLHLGMSSTVPKKLSHSNALQIVATSEAGPDAKESKANPPQRSYCVIESCKHRAGVNLTQHVI